MCGWVFLEVVSSLRRRLPVVLCVNFIILNLSYHYFKEFYYVNYKGYKTFCTFCPASKKVHRKL